MTWIALAGWVCALVAYRRYLSALESIEHSYSGNRYRAAEIKALRIEVADKTAEVKDWKRVSEGWKNELFRRHPELDKQISISELVLKHKNEYRG